MKKFEMGKILPLFSLLILVGWYFYCVNWDINNNKATYQLSLDYYEKQCSQDESKCENKPEYQHMDTIGQMFYTMETSSFNRMILIFIVFITVPGLYQFYKEYKSGYIKNIMVRKKYFSYMKEKVLQAIKRTILIFPLFFIISFIITFILCDGIVDLNYTLSQENFQGIVLPDLVYIKNTFWFCLTFVLNFVLLTITCNFIGFICVKKAKNFALANLYSLLCYMLLDIICSIGIGIFVLEKVLKFNGADYYTGIYNFISYDAPLGYETSWGLLYMTIFAILLVIVSCITFLIVYRDKEKVLIEVEK